VTQTAFDDDAITEPSSIPVPREAFRTPPLPWRAFWWGVATLVVFVVLAWAVATLGSYAVDVAFYGVPWTQASVAISGFVIGAAVGVVAGLCVRRRV
jgi:hypothetical protein